MTQHSPLCQKQMESLSGDAQCNAACAALFRNVCAVGSPSVSGCIQSSFSEVNQACEKKKDIQLLVEGS